MNYPAPRDIPAGKVLLAEYRDTNDGEQSIVERFDKAYSDRVRAEVALLWASPGWECAGAMARWTNGYYAVRWEQFGATQGRRYLATDEGKRQARDHFCILTKTSLAHD